MVSIRPAAEADESTIKRMVRAERLDPTSLDWQHFLVAETNGQIVGIGQVREHGAARELGSLVVLPAYRKQGIAEQLMAALEARSGYPLYLFTHIRTAAFYRKHGYHKIAVRDLPRAMRLKGRAARLMRLFGVRVLAMRKDGPERFIDVSEGLQ